MYNILVPAVMWSTFEAVVVVLVVLLLSEAVSLEQCVGGVLEAGEGVGRRRGGVGGRTGGGVRG